MSVLLQRYCPHCKAKTYHRFKCSLRSSFQSRTAYECIECGRSHEDGPPSAAPGRSGQAAGRCR